MFFSVSRNNFLLVFVVCSLVPKADSRSKLDRVRAKLSVVTMLLPKLTLRELTQSETGKSFGIRIQSRTLTAWSSCQSVDLDTARSESRSGH